VLAFFPGSKIKSFPARTLLSPFFQPFNKKIDEDIFYHLKQPSQSFILPFIFHVNNFSSFNVIFF